jgi:mRNA-degrading endonuclease RelE of RelBE toxin-antitoxin system
MIKVEIEASAERDIDKLDSVIARQVRDKLQALESHPDPHKWLRKVKGAAGNWYRLHVGTDWVVIGQLEGTTYHVCMVKHRSEVYQSVKRR